jgi:hypothetical protein
LKNGSSIAADDRTKQRIELFNRNIGKFRRHSEERIEKRDERMR